MRCVAHGLNLSCIEVPDDLNTLEGRAAGFRSQRHDSAVGAPRLKAEINVYFIIETRTLVERAAAAVLVARAIEDDVGSSVAYVCSIAIARVRDTIKEL